MINKLKPRWLVVSLLIFLAGCQTTGSNVGQVVQSYPNACSSNSFPYLPSCIDILLNYEFDSRSEFQACRQSVSAYEAAVNTFVQCKGRDLKALFDSKISEVKKSYNCYVDFFARNESGDPTTACTLVDEPNFGGKHAADGIELYYGIPNCVRKSNTSLYIPKARYKLSECKSDVDIFLNSSSGLGYRSLSSLVHGATAAQKQYDTFMSNLRDEANKKLDEAVRKFNCKAQRQSYCF